MEAKSRIAAVPTNAFAIAVLVLAAFALLAGGYAIRLATAATPAAVHAASSVSGASSAQSGDTGVSAPTCYWVGGHRGC